MGGCNPWIKVRADEWILLYGTATDDMTRRSFKYESVDFQISGY
jgi:hypothetical protein